LITVNAPALSDFISLQAKEIYSLAFRLFGTGLAIEQWEVKDPGRSSSKRPLALRAGATGGPWKEIKEEGR